MGSNLNASANIKNTNHRNQFLSRTAAMLFVRISSQDLQNTVRAGVANGHPQTVPTKDSSSSDTQSPSRGATICFMLAQSSMADS